MNRNLINGSLAALVLVGLQSNFAFAENLKISSVPKDAHPGERITVEVKTTPKAHCKIAAQGQSITQALALSDKVADNEGKVSWTFEIDKNYKADKIPVIITSSDNSGLDEKVVVAIALEQAPAASKSIELKLESEPQTITLGQETTISVVSEPGAQMKIEAQDAGITQALALVDKMADKDGKTSWTFKVSDDYKADKLPVIITSKYKAGERKLVCSIPINRKM